MRLTKLSSALLMCAVMGAGVLSSASAVAAPDPAKIEARKAQKSQTVSEKVGKAISKAYEMYSADKVNEAIAALQGVEGNSAYDKAFLSRFRGILYSQKDEARALKYMEDAIAADVLSFREHADALRIAGQLATSAKQYEKAIKLLNAYIDFTGEYDPMTYLRIAIAYTELKQYPKVIAAADLAIKHKKENRKEPYGLKLNAYYELKQIGNAVKVAEQMVELFPAEKQFWVTLGGLYSANEQPEKALVVLEMAYKQGLLVKENDIKTLANAYAQNDIPFKAAAILEKHLKSGLIKAERPILSTIANNYQAAREFARAADFYGQVAKLTNDGEIYRRQGNALILAEKFDQAVVVLQKAMEVGVKDKGKLHLDLVDAYYSADKFKEAYRHALAAQAAGQAKAGGQWATAIKERAKARKIEI